MRLTHIKLSGFKSFVDPTAIPVPGQLVAVIGPNGCGKSNVIDAVRWVLGESSAKQLRGESMQDVIFNGSTSRKPVSRASVELVFDNGDASLSGSWGQYSEVAIKRVLTRQGESSYYINNQQVRRRDITDLFLGTGVGARGYAVIEQGMISRIIEARPEELRAYLEEAAGVSKYKERRRETEHRLRDTRDNLERLADLQQELTRQVERLSEQAEVAAHYHDLRGTLTFKQNLLALSRREEASRQEATARAELARIETDETAQEAQASALETALETVREAHFDASDAVHGAQQALFEASGQLARLEEQQRHQGENRQRVERELAALQHERLTLSGSRRQAEATLDEWLPQLEEARLTLEEAQLAQEDDSDALPAAEGVFRSCDAELATLSAQQTRLARERDLAQQGIAHQRATLARIATRRDALSAELVALSLPEPAALAAAQAAADKAKDTLARARARLAADEARQADTASERERAERALLARQSEQARAEAEAEAIAGLLARESAGDALADFLHDQQLADSALLWQSLDVAEPWRDAVGAVLGARLGARSAPLPEAAPPAALTLVDRDLPARAVADTRCALASHVRAAAPFAGALTRWLDGLYCADSLPQALSRRAELGEGEAWITPQGHRVDAVSVAFHAAASGSALMAHKAELEAAQARAASLAPEIAALQQQRERASSLAAMLAEAVRAQKNVISQLEQEVATTTLAFVQLDQATRQGAARLAAIESERTRLDDEASDAAAAIDELGYRAEESSMTLDELALQLEDVRLARLNAETGLELARGKLRETERRVHEATLALNTAEQKSAEAGRRAQELAEREAQLAERQQALLEEADSVAEAVPEQAIQQALAEREACENTLARARDTLAALTEQQRTLLQQQQALATTLPALRDARSEWLLKHQEARLNVERFAEELRAAEADEAELTAALSDAVKPAALAAEIARLARALEGLGAVNLAALEELSEARRRGDYLAAQSADLTQAMATLEEAIARIDGETRDMLQTTYQAVNAKMSEFFPTLFGGGRAELVLTGDDLLDAGIQIIAQPPGKKNSTIHLLSGGEKALTAMSLVFALFSLNPAPFCLLDEVDAPLDDANTGRFCQLVKQMSAGTQFLYISHNRLTMEMAEQLVGVTMQEQGVSRIVAVDIVEALKMREAG